MSIDDSVEKIPAKVKAMEWVKRYGPAEIIGTVTAVAAAYAVPEGIDIMAESLNQNPDWLGLVKDISLAYGGTWGENIGFYGTMAWRQYKEDKETNGENYGVAEVAKTTLKLATEFGPAEFLDTWIIRPATMGFGAKLLGKGVGVLAGKLAADVAFYIPTIISYEARKKIE